MRDSDCLHFVLLAVFVSLASHLNTQIIITLKMHNVFHKKSFEEREVIQCSLGVVQVQLDDFGWNRLRDSKASASY